MSTFSERFTAKVADIDAQIAKIQTEAQDAIQRLQRRRQALIRASQALTPAMETALNDLLQENIL
jgi:ABC-type transporter Mla subunit MlaD